jgi:uncharacterized protein (DUF1697 family)
MTTFVALFRGINVGGRGRVGMNRLIELCESMGFTKVRTYLQSGNVVFDFPKNDPVHISELIGEQISQIFAFPVEVILRNSIEFRQVIRHNPFLKENWVDNDTLYITFLSEHPREVLNDFLKSGEEGLDKYILVGKEVYLSCPNGYGRTKFSNSFFEKKLGVAATTRNWKTINALADLAEGLAREA